ncbi:MAG: hypothetical protein EXQ95_03340 [Alphaproteobacteria bacterium]|nr:hypothetical protein [Alphaproteobacteria bacterium]
MLFDHATIVTGSGPRGVLAARLSEVPRVRILRLAAGREDRHPRLHIPIGYSRTFCDPRSLGGSSSIDGLGFTRNQAMDQDFWEPMGNRGWSFAEAPRCFRRMERVEGSADDLGGGGPMSVSYARDH